MKIDTPFELNARLIVVGSLIAAPRGRSPVGEERGYLVELDQPTTLGLTFRNVEANVADLGYGIDGLIGMNVLSKLNFEVRPAERRILVEKLAGA